MTISQLQVRKIAERLRDLGVSRAQITLDGTAEHHNRRRFRKGGAATFDRIVQNIVASRDLLKHPGRGESH